MTIDCLCSIVWNHLIPLRMFRQMLIGIKQVQIHDDQNPNYIQRYVMTQWCSTFLALVAIRVPCRTTSCCPITLLDVIPFVLGKLVPLQCTPSIECGLWQSFQHLMLSMSYACRQIIIMSNRLINIICFSYPKFLQSLAKPQFSRSNSIMGNYIIYQSIQCEDYML